MCHRIYITGNGENGENGVNFRKKLLLFTEQGLPVHSVELLCYLYIMCKWKIYQSGFILEN